MTALSLLIPWSSSGFFMPRGIATLMPDCKPPPPPACIPISQTPFPGKQGSGYRKAPDPKSHSPARALWVQLLRAILDEIVHQLGSRVVHFNHEAINLAGEVVEKPHGRNCDYQTKRSRKQRFR